MTQPLHTQERPSTTESRQAVVHRPRRRPSLRELATKLNVSHTAVARAVHGKEGLSDELRERILNFARKEGYVLNDVTQSLIRGETGTIGIIVPRLAGPFIDVLVSGIADVLWEEDAVPLVLNSQLDPSREEAILEKLSTKRIDALIIMPCAADRSEDHFVHLLKHHTPIVALDNAIASVNVPVVGSNDRRGGEAVTQHLVELGHKHITYFGAALEIGEPVRAREHGYENVMRNNGLMPRVINLPHRRMVADEVFPLLDDWFESEEGRKATAVFAFNDYVAWSIYTIARRKGIRIGKDLAVVGYGNARSIIGAMPDAFDLVEPALSSVEQYPEQWGRLAVNIARRMAAGESVPRETLVEPSLVVRASSDSQLREPSDHIENEKAENDDNSSPR